MILDTSAIVAMVLQESHAERLEQALARDAYRAIGAPTLLESGLVLTSRSGSSSRTQLTTFLERTGAAVLPFGDQHWPVALDAFERFGKGRRPAALNLGDCFSYAVAKVAGEPLLFVGNDFPRTDLALVR